MRNGASEDFYYHPDGLGSIANLTNASGATQWTYEYEPFGNERVATPASGAPVNRMRFTGQYLDVDTGLYHLRARQYDPANGRFTATDPIPAAITDPYVAAYVYVGNRSTVFIDPSGESWWDPRDLPGAAGGIAQELWDTGKGFAQLGLAMTNPVSAARYWRGQVKQLIRDYRAQGGGFMGALDAMNFRNPGFRFLVGQKECRDALERRSSQREVGRACTAAALRAAELGLVAVGGAKAATSGRVALRDSHERAAAKVGVGAIEEAGPALRTDIQLSGGRGGGAVKTLTGPPNSIVRGAPGRIYQTDSEGRVIADITAGRVKPVTPGRGFGPKRPPTPQELEWLNRAGG